MKLFCRFFAVFSLIVIIGCTKEQAVSGPVQEAKSVQKRELSGDLRVYQSQPESQSGMLALVNAFQAAYPNVKTEWVSSPIQLTEAIAAGTLPDIFYTTGYTGMTDFIEHIEDLSDQDWLNNLNPSILPAITYNEKVYGMPLSIVGLGVIYNKKMFAQHEWEIPKTRTEFFNLCDTIKKTGITPLVNEFGDDWYLGNHFLGIVFANMPDPDGFLKGLFDGQAKFSNSKEMLDSFNVLDAMLKYGQPDPMAYFWNEASSAFALGEAAMFMGGDWYWETLNALDPDIDCAIFPFPVQEDPAAAKMVVDINFAWHVAKGSKNQEAALEFLNWMATDPEAKRILLEEMRIVPVFKGWEFKADSKLAESTVDYYSRNMIYNFYWPRLPSAFPVQAGSIYQGYINGQYTREQALKEMDNVWAIQIN